MTSNVVSIPSFHHCVPLSTGFTDDFDRVSELYKVANTDANLIFGFMDADAETLTTSASGRNDKP